MFLQPTSCCAYVSKLSQQALDNKVLTTMAVLTIACLGVALAAHLNAFLAPSALQITLWGGAGALGTAVISSVISRTLNSKYIKLDDLTVNLEQSDETGRLSILQRMLTSRDPLSLDGFKKLHAAYKQIQNNKVLSKSELDLYRQVQQKAREHDHSKAFEAQRLKFKNLYKEMANTVPVSTESELLKKIPKDSILVISGFARCAKIGPAYPAELTGAELRENAREAIFKQFRPSSLKKFDAKYVQAKARILPGFDTFAKNMSRVVVSGEATWSIFEIVDKKEAKISAGIFDSYALEKANGNGVQIRGQIRDALDEVLEDTNLNVLGTAGKNEDRKRLVDEVRKKYIEDCEEAQELSSVDIYTRAACFFPLDSSDEQIHVVAQVIRDIDHRMDAGEQVYHLHNSEIDGGLYLLKKDNNEVITASLVGLVDSTLLTTEEKKQKVDKLVASVDDYECDIVHVPNGKPFLIKKQFPTEP